MIHFHITLESFQTFMQSDAVYFIEIYLLHANLYAVYFLNMYANTVQSIEIAEVNTALLDSYRRIYPNLVRITNYAQSGGTYLI